MTWGPGKYDDVLTVARDSCEATGAVLIVFDGKHGNGFAVHATSPQLSALPDVLRHMANGIEADLRDAQA